MAAGVGRNEQSIGAECERRRPALSIERLRTVTSAPSAAASFTAMCPSPPRPITPTRLPGPTFQVRSGE